MTESKAMQILKAQHPNTGEPEPKHNYTPIPNKVVVGKVLHEEVQRTKEIIKDLIRNSTSVKTE